MWKLLDAQLGKTRFFAANELTVGGIAFGNAVHRWYLFKIERPELPNLRAWCERLAYRKVIMGK